MAWPYFRVTVKGRRDIGRLCLDTLWFSEDLCNRDLIVYVLAGRIVFQLLFAKLPDQSGPILLRRDQNNNGE